jgi:hypothetical protein
MESVAVTLPYRSFDAAAMLEAGGLSLKTTPHFTIIASSGVTGLVGTSSAAYNSSHDQG